jgi:hypothetical protein
VMTKDGLRRTEDGYWKTRPPSFLVMPVLPAPNIRF